MEIKKISSNNNSSNSKTSKKPITITKTTKDKKSYLTKKEKKYRKSTKFHPISIYDSRYWYNGMHNAILWIYSNVCSNIRHRQTILLRSNYILW